MGFFQKKSDPISDRARALNRQIATLEARIKDLDSKVEKPSGKIRVRSTALPHGQAAPVPATVDPVPVFEEVDAPLLKERPVEAVGHFNELGVRKYDLVAAWRRLQNHFRGPAANNSKLVSYLAAGSIQGLRPLRYEKRVARNRVLGLFFLMVLILWGVAYYLLHPR